MFSFEVKKKTSLLRYGTGSLEVLYGFHGFLGISKLQVLIKKIVNFFFAVDFVHFLVINTLDPGSGFGFALKPMRIHNTGKSTIRGVCDLHLTNVRFTPETQIHYTDC